MNLPSDRDFIAHQWIIMILYTNQPITVVKNQNSVHALKYENIPLEKETIKKVMFNVCGLVDEK